MKKPLFISGFFVALSIAFDRVLHTIRRYE
ncbi:MAG: hypothetical protein ACI9TH_003410 [Kiritimatiellia bacterium]|jgi:hypothetical protein